MTGELSKTDIEQAHDRIRPYTVHTPVLTNDVINRLTGSSIFFKCENLQKVGAFKARGAMNAILSLPKEKMHKGVATHSSGNHAQAVARSAAIMGVKSYIVMPRTATEIKKKGVRRFQGEIFECEPTLEAREATLKRIVEDTGATEIHPFNDYHVMAGQATSAKELFEEISDLDFILAPVGGGGLLSGTCLAARYFSPDTDVIGAEPAGSDDAYRSLLSGKIERAQSDTIADGLLTSLGDKTFPIIRNHVKKIIPVTDPEIVKAMRLLWEHLKVIIEPSSAVVLAAVLKEPDLFSNKRVGMILSGGNVDAAWAVNLFTTY
jgi:threonine dehydratase